MWLDRIKRDKRDFNVAWACVCSLHFTDDDFINPKSKLRRLKPESCPSVFSWTKAVSTRKPPAERLNTEDEETDTASETESGELPTQDQAVQINMPMSCSHSFSIEQLLAKSKFNKGLFKFYTGFNDYKLFTAVLELLVPDQDRDHITYYDTRNKEHSVTSSDLMDSEVDKDSDSDSDAEPATVNRKKRIHSLSVENEFLLTLMKLRQGLANVDLGVRFCVSNSTVSRICITWINIMYIKLGSLNIWPHRDILIHNMSDEYKAQYPTTIAIIDATELKIEKPSSLKLQSQTYSTYKSANTLKSLIGVDSNGGIIFVSQLFTGSMSDQEICRRSGFYSLLDSKVQSGELLPGDGIMADKGFDIEKDLRQIGLGLNIPPFLGKRGQLSAQDVKETQKIAHHRIHVERAIGKVKCFKILGIQLPLVLVGTLNQIWTVCCLLSNFQDAIVKPKNNSDPDE